MRDGPAAPGCLGCTCSSAQQTAPGGRLLLSTQVQHTVAALRSLGRRTGVALRSVAPGLLSVEDADVHDFLLQARQVLSTVEADEVRCLIDAPVSSETAVLAAAMTAPSLTQASARVVHADLVPLFEDESACFHAVYQPIVELAGGRTLGYEALLRGVTPSGAPLTPAELFPAAEEAGWTHLLDRVGRTTALRDAGPWLGDDLLFINFVPTSIYRPEVCLRTTEAAARRAGIRLDHVVFEVTESHLVRDVDHLERVFAHYRERGCRVALDDLGAGYSSLNMLVRLRPDVVKLDKELVQNVTDPVGAAVVAAIVQITHAYGGLVLAECVETAEQAQAVTELGVDLGQGWLYGRPERPGAPAQPPRAGAVRDVDPARPDSAVAVGTALTARPIEPPAERSGRTTLLDELDSVLDTARRDQQAVVVLCVGLDPAAEHPAAEVGDGVLSQVTERLRTAVRPGDLLGHVGGGEFVAVLAGVDPLDADRVGERAAQDVRAALQRPVTAGPVQARLLSRVGLALFPADGGTGAELLRRADNGMRLSVVGPAG